MRRLVVMVMMMFSIAGCNTVSEKPGDVYQSHLIKGERYLAASNHEEATREFTKALEIGKKGKQTLIPEVMLGETFLKKGDLDAAGRIAKEIVAKYPKDASGWEFLGKVSFRRYNLKEAQVCFEKALEVSTKQDKNRVKSLLALTEGLDYYSRGEVGKAKKSWGNISDKKLAYEAMVKAEELFEINL